MSEKKSLDILLKLLKKRNLKSSEVKNFLRNNTLDLNALDKNGYNALHYAIKSELPEIVKIMLSSGNEDDTSIKADPNIETKDKINNIYTSPLLLSLLYTNDQSISMQIIRHLCKAGAKINYADEEGSTLFLLSCEKGRTDIISYLINKIIKDKEDNINNINGDIDVKNLINSNSKNGSGLHFAIIGQQDEVIELLLENNIDLNICNSQGDTALLFALKEKQMNTFKTLFDYLLNNKEINNEEKKKIFNHQNNEGNTILHELAFCKSSVLTNIVLKLPEEIKIDTEIKNKEGYNYKEVSDNIILLEKKKKEEENMIKEQRRKLKEELRQKKYEEEKKIMDEKKKYEEALRRQEEFGEKLIEHRGKIFLAILVIFLGLMYLMIKHALTKKDRVI